MHGSSHSQHALAGRKHCISGLRNDSYWLKYLKWSRWHELHHDLVYLNTTHVYDLVILICYVMLQYGTVRNVNPSSSQTDSLSMEAIVQSKPPVKPNPAPYAPFLRCPDVEGKTERSRENLQPWHVGSSLIAIHQSCGSYGFWVSDEQSKKVAFQRLSPSIVSVQHQQASGVLKASWNVGKPFCKYLKHSKTNDAAFVSQANHTSK